MPSKITGTTSFRKDLDKLEKQGKDMTLLTDVINMLAAGTLPKAKYKHHKLKGHYAHYANCYDCHIESDWVLIYHRYKEKGVSVIECLRTGSHSEVF